MVIEAKKLSKIYGAGESRVTALDQAELKIGQGDFLSITGPSGSGKSTLLHLLSGLDRPTSGSLSYDGKDIYKFHDRKLSAFCRRRISFVFQQFNLLPVLTARENMLMPLLLDKRQPDSVVNESVGFTAADLEKLSKNEAAESVAAIQFSLYDTDEKIAGMSPGFELKPGETLQIVGFNEIYMDYYTDGKLSEEESGCLAAGKGCVVKNPFPIIYEGKELEHSEFSPGDVISVHGQKLPVIAAFSGTDGFAGIGSQGFTNGVQVIVSDQLYPELTGKNEYQEMLPVLKEHADRAQFDRALETLCKEIPGTTFLSYEDTDRQLSESYEQIRLLAWGLILLIGLIGLLNIVNTVYTNIHTRVAEIGMQRAVGMSRRMLYETFLWEGAYYGIAAAVVGCPAGYVCTVFVNAARTDALQLVPAPAAAMTAAAVLSILSCLAATGIPLRRIEKMSIVDSIEAVE